MNDMLKDRLVCGINDEKMQLKLLAGKATLTFENAMELARTMEAASKNAMGLGARIAGTSATVNAMKQSSSATQGKCFSCGANHLRQCQREGSQGCSGAQNTPCCGRSTTFSFTQFN